MVVTMKNAILWDVTLKMVMSHSLKCQFELELYGTKSQKVSTIDITVKSYQKTVFFGYKYYPSLERLINSSPKCWIRLELQGTKSKKASINHNTIYMVTMTSLTMVTRHAAEKSLLTNDTTTITTTSSSSSSSSSNPV
jgi:hypothetical protein